MSPRTSMPTQPYTPGEQMGRPAEPAAREAMDREAARLAMQSDHHAFAGSAQGVGSVTFDDPGAYDVGQPGVRPLRGMNPDPSFGSHADPHPDAETRRVRVGGLAPGDDGSDAHSAADVEDGRANR